MRCIEGLLEYQFLMRTLLGVYTGAMGQMRESRIGLGPNDCY